MQSMLFDPPAPPAPEPKGIALFTEYPGVRLFRGDCIEVMNAMPRNCVDASGTDGPYGLGFMNKPWDTFAPDVVRTAAAMKQRKDPEGLANLQNVYGRKRSPAQSPSQIAYDETLEGHRRFQQWTEEWARALFRVLKPGAHVFSCGAPRSAHRMISGLEDAGFEIRDSFAWLFGQGFPKSHNLTDDDGEKNGFGTALKPGHEPIVLARKPFEGTVEENFARWGVGALSIDACRLEAATGDGRWPANVLLDEQAASLLDEQAASLLDEQAASLLDEQAGERVSGANPTRRGSDKFRKIFGKFKGEAVCRPARGAESGGASRFYFVAKPSQLERNFGCDDLPQLTAGEMTDREAGSAGLTPYAGAGRSGGGRNPHPTVKPVSLMRYLLRLVVPTGGVVIDPFLGSGTTGMAAVVDGYRFIGIEREEQYLKAADARISATYREVHP